MFGVIPVHQGTWQWVLCSPALYRIWWEPDKDVPQLCTHMVWHGLLWELVRGAAWLLMQQAYKKYSTWCVLSEYLTGECRYSSSCQQWFSNILACDSLKWIKSKVNSILLFSRAMSDFHFLRLFLVLQCQSAISQRLGSNITKQRRWTHSKHYTW